MRSLSTLGGWGGNGERGDRGPIRRSSILRVGLFDQRPGGFRKEQVVTNFWNRTKDFLQSEDGPTATEYAVMLALIIVAAIGSIQLVGTKVSDTFTAVEAALPTVGGS